MPVPLVAHHPHHFMNIGAGNRVFRVFVGLVLVLVGFGVYRGTYFGDALMAISLPFLATGCSGFCPVAALFHRRPHPAG